MTKIKNTFLQYLAYFSIISIYVYRHDLLNYFSNAVMPNNDGASYNFARILDTLYLDLVLDFIRPFVAYFLAAVIAFVIFTYVISVIARNINEIIVMRSFSNISPAQHSSYMKEKLASTAIIAASFISLPLLVFKIAPRLLSDIDKAVRMSQIGVSTIAKSLVLASVFHAIVWLGKSLASNK